MDPKEELKACFVAAIRKAFTPCPLIGDKWFHYHGAARPPRFEFTGAKKLAKATSKPVGAVANALLKNLDLDGRQARVEVTKAGDIRLYLAEPEGTSSQ